MTDNSPLSRYQDHPEKITAALKKQKCLVGLSSAEKIAQEIYEKGELRGFKNEEVLITEGGADQPLYFLISGKVSLHVKGNRLPYGRLAGYTVGELSATQDDHLRTATVKADGEVVAVSLSDSRFNQLLNDYPEVYKGLFQDVAGRLLQRNDFLPSVNEKPTVFLISSAEANGVLKRLLVSLEYEDFDVIPWSGPASFQAGNSTIDELKRNLDLCDFAVAIASPDDTTTSRDNTSPSVRDNVIFELGFFMGVLGKERAFYAIDANSEVKAKVPSDLDGITPLRYKMEKGNPNVQTMAIHLSERIKQLGLRQQPKN